VKCSPAGGPCLQPRVAGARRDSASSKRARAGEGEWVSLCHHPRAAGLPGTLLPQRLAEELQLEGGSGIKAVGSPAPFSIPASLAIPRAWWLSTKALLLSQP